MQDRVLYAIGNLDRGRPVRELHLPFKIGHVDDCVTKLCRTQAEVIPNHENLNICGIGDGEVRHRKCKRLKHCGFGPVTVQPTAVSE
jgi:hypothetical protein